MATSPSSREEVEGVAPDDAERFNLIVCAMWLSYSLRIYARDFLL